MRSKSFKLVFALIVVLAFILIGYSVFAVQNHNRRIGQKLTIEQKEEKIDKKVEEGTITKEKAEEIKAKLQDCDPENPQRLGQEYKLNFGRPENTDQKGLGQSQRNGKGLRNGNCKLTSEQ